MASPASIRDASRHLSARVPSSNDARRLSKRPRIAAAENLPCKDGLRSLASASTKSLRLDHASISPSLPSLLHSTSREPSRAGKQLGANPSSVTALAVHKRRFTRSRSGCSTCRTRKVKCDEARPHCHRCVEDGRKCQGYIQQKHSDSHTLQRDWQKVPAARIAQPYTDQRVEAESQQRLISSNDRLSTSSFDALAPYPATSPQDLDDWINLLCSSIGNDLPPSDTVGISGVKPTRLPTLDRTSEADLQRRIRALCVTKVQLESVSFFFNTTARCFHLLSADTNVWRIFFAQLASESPVILDLVGCLGLTHLSLTQDHRRKALAHAHFSRCKTEWDSIIGPLHSPDAIEHALTHVTTAHRVLEVLAGTILIAHIEQFSRGFATCSRAYTSFAIAVIRRSTRSSSAAWTTELDQGPGSAFRFFVRILLWWETMSRTMGPASEQGDVLDIFQSVYQWEEPDDPGRDPIDCLTQCVVGWPLDLLEAVERITLLSTHHEIVSFLPQAPSSIPLAMPSATLSHAFESRIPLRLQQQIETVETQIRLARPLPLVQDDSIAAELRYLIFECLQSASLVYLCRMLLKSTDAVWFEIDKVTCFLERKQHHADQSDAVGSSRTAFRGNGSSGADLQLTQAMEMRGKWWIRAPDGALIWAYFQCASEIFGVLEPALDVVPYGKGSKVQHQFGSGEPFPLALGSQITLGSDFYPAYAQSRSERRQRCRRSLLLWEKFDEIQCVFLCRHLLKAIWDRRDLYEQENHHVNGTDTTDVGANSSEARYDQAGELQEICRQRRWRQPLIF
ncbi:potential fungal zinc cluster transcription factor [Pseudozyma hubeiensis SY62]|uniref:Potential fungal zinc cluster transcription factor n=1 Tax=Pseudozyma hubeiensis (strain SY62) TaxID=1305764 RepID=R9PAI1_PSEHS|nr:potential fungal zinc cluster transcription factor [Pseudozyma hubeiensis SY62]GAC98257.1 potential fungal zinc cluster transcription factor [Pseudozyma hubeiensis SY62]